MDDLPSVAEDAKADPRFKALQDGAEPEESAEDDPAAGDCLDRAYTALKSGDKGAFRSAMQEAITEYGKGAE